MDRRILIEIKREVLEQPGATGLLVGTFAVSIGLIWMFSGGQAGIRGNPGLYLYGGLLSAHGYPMYMYLFDIKGPAIYLFYWVIGTLVGGDPEALYSLSVGFAVALAITIFPLVEIIVWELTDSKVAGILAVFVLLVHQWWIIPIWGLSTKMIGGALILAVFLSVIHRNFILASFFAATAAATWQLLTPIWFIILGTTLAKGKYKTSAGVVAVGVALAALMIAPFFTVGAGTAMITQVVLPLFARTPTVSIFDSLAVIRELGTIGYLAIMAVLGYLTAVTNEYIQDRLAIVVISISVGIVWLIATFSWNVHGLDFVVFVPLIALGVGLLAGQDPQDRFPNRIVPRIEFTGVLVTIAIVLAYMTVTIGNPSSELQNLYLSATPPENCINLRDHTFYAKYYIPTTPEIERTCWSPSKSRTVEWLISNFRLRFFS